ncbi:MAG TPA: methyltransferase domain-containing protein [Gaiellaceae bacterium]|nr:methyltransferase domain-containing protein [Gaiellaceae bacterium]
MSSHASFSGSVPEIYNRLLGPVLFEPYARDLVARLDRRDGVRVLEVACGTGIVTRRLREELPQTSTLVATDLNEPMLDEARQNVPLLDITWQTADAQELPFPDGSFDAYVCQFGLMFLSDKVRGFGEARRVLAPGGQLLANVWLSGADNEHVPVIQSVLDRLFPDSPPTFLDVPHGYHDFDRIRADLEAAGWSDAMLDTVRISAESPTALDFATGFAAGSPLAHELVSRDADPNEVAQEMAEGLAAVGGSEPYRVELGAIVISAARA